MNNSRKLKSAFFIIALISMTSFGMTSCNNKAKTEDGSMNNGSASTAEDAKEVAEDKNVLVAKW